MPNQPTVSRPNLLDYFLVLGGMGLSVYLMQLAPIYAEAEDDRAGKPFAALIAFMPSLMRLPEGIILLFPLFLATQWPSRSRGLTLGEWLWLAAWFGAAVLTILTFWEVLAGLPGWLQPHAVKPRLLWYALFLPSLAALAVVFLAFSLFRPPAPWTHTFGLALLLWPAAPVLIVLFFGKFVLR